MNQVHTAQVPDVDLLFEPPHAPVSVPTGPVRQEVRWRRNILLAIAIGWLGLVGLLAVCADLLPIQDYATPLGAPSIPPRWSWDEPLGTDALGRSQLSRVIYGARVSLAVGLSSVLLGLVIGGAIGAISGYFRGRIERVLNVFVDATLAFPPLVLLLAIAAVRTQSISSLVIALTLLAVPSYARLARAHTISIAQREYVLAARALGARDGRVLCADVMPNVLLPVASYAFIVVATVMVAEGSLSYLALGIPPPQPSWGGMIAAGVPYLSDSPHLVFVPAAVFIMTVFSLNVIGDRARRRFDRRGSAL